MWVQGLALPLPVVVNSEEARKEGAPLLHDEAPNNVAFEWEVGGGDWEKAWVKHECANGTRTEWEVVTAAGVELYCGFANGLKVTLKRPCP